MTESGAEKKQEEPINLLHVDDSETFAPVVQMALKMEGFNVDSLRSLKAVRNLSLKDLEKYGIILVDMDLQDGTGDDVVEEVRNKGYKGPVAGMSARQDPKSEESLVKGAKKTFAKGIGLEELAQGLRDLISPPQPSQNQT